MEKNMNENFKKLNNRVVDSLNDTDLEKLNYLLSKIKDPTLGGRWFKYCCFVCIKNITYEEYDYN
mgnify:CR=1 FL=1